MITKNTIEVCAPLYYEAIKTHLETLRAMRDRSGKYSIITDRIELFMRASGLTAADMMSGNFEKSMMDNDAFITSAILFTCACMITNRNTMSIPEYREYLGTLQDVLDGHTSTYDTIKYFSHELGIDADVVPNDVKEGMAEVDEERAADKICNRSFEKLDTPETYPSFDVYYQYMKENGLAIINELTTEGYSHTYDPDTFAQLMILKKLNFPVGTLYSIQRDLPAPKGIIDVLTKKLFALRHEGGLPGGGGIVDLSGDDGM